MTRALKEGRLTSRRQGRTSLYAMTGAYLERFNAIERRFTVEPVWEGFFHSVVYDLPESRRSERDGLRAALGVREEFPDAGILVLSQYVGNEYARRLLAGAHGNSGGTGYLLKESVGRISQFLSAVEEVGAGGVSIDPRVVTELFARPAASPLDELSPRHREVLELVAQGRTNAQIARELYVSRATLERLVSQIFVSLGLSEQDGNRRVLAVLEYLRSPVR